MKKLINLSAVLLLMSTTALFSQTLPVTIVFSQNKCGFNHMDELAKDTESKTGPILNGLVKEGMLINWGVMTHAWGDEWNWNVYYVAENPTKFHAAWDEFVKRMSEKHPELWDRWGEMCSEHKDSMYTQTHGYVAEAGNDDE